MTFKISLKPRTSARAVKLACTFGAALLVAACATGTQPHSPAHSEAELHSATQPAPEFEPALAKALLNDELTEQEWQKIAASEMQAVAGSQPIISPTGTISANKQRKIALRKLAEKSIRADAPGDYTVVRGDTLWHISERFLSRPWLWPEIWHVNPQIENPHLIYPGDRIALTYVEGSPRLELFRASTNPSRQSAPIGTIPADVIDQFLVKTLVVTQADINSSAYVAATEEGRLIGTAGDHIYARGDVDGSRYSIYRPGKRLVDPDTEEVLGYETIHVSNASLVSAGDPSKLILTSSSRETLKGDRLLQNDAPSPAFYQPRAASTTSPGKIISLVDAVSQGGQNQVVVLNLGDNDGVQAGDTFSVVTNDRVVRDDVANARSEFFTVEGEESGIVMVFRTFDNVSYALIMSSTREVSLFDRVISTASEL